MAVLSLFFEIASLLKSPGVATEHSLEQIALAYPNYAYIGARRDLADAVLSLAERLPNNKGSNADDWVRQWFGTKDWKKNSGTFPDFVLSYQNSNIPYNGALLELKDSKGSSIASFNSTLPSARKFLSTMNPMVSEAVKRWDYPSSEHPEYPFERDCFYLIRTQNSSQSQVRISLIHGSFFETIPVEQLLTSVWKDMLQGIASEQEIQQVSDVLARIARADISSTRHIPGASVKPRLRLMSEIETEGNPHTYEEILPRTFNLILKPNVDTASEFPDVLNAWARNESLNVIWSNQSEFWVSKERGSAFRVIPLKHKRNGLFMVVQSPI